MVNNIYVDNGIVYRRCEKFVLSYISNANNIKLSSNGVKKVSEKNINNIIKILTNSTEKYIPNFNNHPDIDDVKIHASYVNIFIYRILIANKCKFK
jgi:hypothetical protein